MRYFLPVVLIGSFFASCAKGTESGSDTENVVTNTGGGSSSHGTGGGAGGDESCPQDTFEPNDSCAGAKKVGVVSDANTNAITIVGNLTDGSDEDWYTFDTVDTTEGTGNSYHISIAFSDAADEFAFDVIRGDACAAPAADHSNLKSYTWCVDGSAGDADAGTAIGERDCGKFDGGGACTDHSSPYFVRVHKSASYAGSCDSYEFKVTAKGGDTCDFTQSCDPATGN